MTSKAISFGGAVSGATTDLKSPDGKAIEANHSDPDKNSDSKDANKSLKRRSTKTGLTGNQPGRLHGRKDSNSSGLGAGSSHALIGHPSAGANHGPMPSHDEVKALVLVRAKTTIKYGFGSNMISTDPIQSIGLHQSNDKDNNDRLLFKLGNQLVLHDPDTNQQHFLDLSRSVMKINHFVVSQNHKYIAVCEVVRSSDEIVSNGNESKNLSIAASNDDQTMSVVSIYDIKSLKKIKTLSKYPVPYGQSKSSDFSMGSFTADTKIFVSLSGRSEEGNTKEVCLWSWEKERLQKSFEVADAVTRVRGGTSNIAFITASGAKHLKSYYIGSDSSIKSTNLLPPSREQDYDFVEHIWLLPHSGLHKIVVLGETSSSATSGASIGSGDDHSSISQSGSYVKRQYVFIFEGNEVAPTITNTGVAMLAAPINLELRQTIAMKSVHNIGFRIESFAACGKGFIVVGSYGHVAIYDRTDEKRDPYVEVKKFTIGHMHLLGVAVYPSEDKFNVISDSGRILSLTMDASVHMRNALASQQHEKSSDALSEGRRPGALKNDDFQGLDNRSIADVIPGGFHSEPIKSADLAFNRPVMVTISADRTARFWNYETLKCELVYDFATEEPLAVAIHSSGFQVLVSFKDRVRMYNMLLDRLEQYQETIQKSCKDIKFSNGCQYWAGASGISVVVYETKSFNQLMTFQGHMMSVQRLFWAPGDQLLFSSGLDGNVYGWIVSNMSTGNITGGDNRIDIVTANNRQSTLTAMAIDCPSTSFSRSPNANAIEEEGKVLSDSDRRSQVILSSANGSIKMPGFSLGKTSTVANMLLGANDFHTPPSIPGDPRLAITSMCLTADRRHLIAGTSVGTVRIYAWPPATIEGTLDTAAYIEVLAHAGPVIAITIAPHQNVFMTAGDDGTVFVHSLVRGSEYERTLIDAAASKIVSVPGNSSVLEADEPFRFNSDVALVAADEIEEHVREVSELNKTVADLKAKHSYEVSELNASHAEELKKIYDRHESVLYEEQCKYENLKNESERKMRDLTDLMDSKEVDYIKSSTELENRYEHKLADQLDRYDRLAEEMEALRQNCEALLRDERLRAERMLSDHQAESHVKEKTLTTANKRLTEDKRNESNTFQEILEQQEGEYEDELRQLIAAAEAELASEREIVLNLRTIVQTKNTKLDQMKKKLEELNTTAKARLKLLDNERAEKIRLMETLNHYKHNLREREEALSEKEKVISDLRSTTRTLENFRFVLDHRLQQLSAERGPITNHIERLERHIRTMYEELVEEFDLKKASAEDLAIYEAKLSRANKDLTAARYEVSVRERYIASFKRDIENIVASMVTGKELEESLQELYKKYIQTLTTSEDPNISATAMLAVCVDEGSMLRGNPKVKEKVESLLHGSNGNSAKMTQSSHRKGKGHSSESILLASPHGSHQLPMSPSFANPSTGNLNTISSQKRFVRDVEDTLVETAKESDRQRAFKEREANDLRHRLEIAKTQNERIARRYVKDNNQIISEYNELRKHSKNVEHQLNIAKEQLKDVQNQLLQLQLQQAGQSSLYGGTSVVGSIGRVTSSVGRRSSASRDQRSRDTPSSPRRSDAMNDMSPISRGKDITSVTDSVFSGNDGNVQEEAVNPHLATGTIGFDARMASLSPVKSAIPTIQQPRSCRPMKQPEDIAKVTMKLLEKSRAITTPGQAINHHKAPHHETMTTNATDLSLTSTSLVDLHEQTLTMVHREDRKNGSNSRGSNRFKSRTNLAAGAGPSIRHELQVQRLENDLEMLQKALDESSREKEMQRFEIGRLRRQVGELMNRMQREEKLHHRRNGSLLYNESNGQDGLNTIDLDANHPEMELVAPYAPE